MGGGSAIRLSERRRRILQRALPVAAFAAVAFCVGAIVGARHTGPGQRVAKTFTRAWERGDYGRMYGLLSDSARRRSGRARFERAYRAAAATATMSRLRAARPRRERDGIVVVPVRVRTRLFGVLHARLRLPVVGEGDAARVDWRPELAFPGLRTGERLARVTELPDRAAILARDGTPLATGPDRTSPLGSVATEIVGDRGQAPRNRASALRAAGYPPDAQVGLNGLERVFEATVAGRPGGVLLAGSRVIGRARARPGRAVRTTIDPDLERAAIAALAGRYGAVAVVRPRNGEILALAGVAFSALQPPGSTFKIVTAAGALRARLVRETTPFPVQTSARLAGVELENANGEACGGTFAQAFARSCNSVFAPLGARLGARRLVAAARAFGFGEPAPFPGAAVSTIPSPDQIGDDLAVGSTAIGQGRVQATALQMAIVAATIAGHGRRPRPTLVRGRHARRLRVFGGRVGYAVERLMLGVVRFGTGTAAAIPGVEVAGKTGTAELKTTVRPADQQDAARTTPDQTAPGDDLRDTDAWFAGYAPARHPRVAISVMLVRAGAGGDVAAPAARTVLQAALK